MTEQQALTRCVEAFERIATALETMARQQGEFLATMPAEEAEPIEVPEGMTATPIAAVPLHAYEADCACPSCWAERRRRRQAGAP